MEIKVFFFWLDGVFFLLRREAYGQSARVPIAVGSLGFSDLRQGASELVLFNKMQLVQIGKDVARGVSQSVQSQEPMVIEITINDPNACNEAE